MLEIERLSTVEKTSHVVGSENWVYTSRHFAAYSEGAVWEVRKQKSYGNDSYPRQLQQKSSAGHQAPVGGRVGNSGKSGISHGKGEGHVVHAGEICVCNVCGFAHLCRCIEVC